MTFLSLGAYRSSGFNSSFKGLGFEFRVPNVRCSRTSHVCAEQVLGLSCKVVLSLFVRVIWAPMIPHTIGVKVPTFAQMTAYGFGLACKSRTDPHEISCLAIGSIVAPFRGCLIIIGF